MLFSEVYGSYFQVVAAILDEAVQGTLTERRLGELVRQGAFAESALFLPAALKGGRWPLIDADFRTPLHHRPSMPLTTLQRRWLKALLADPRVRLFAPPTDGLDDVDPLYTPDMFAYFDRYTDGDPYEDEGYIARFRTILTALREQRRLRIDYTGRRGKRITRECMPTRLEYSEKDDKFRLSVAQSSGTLTVNLARLNGCALLERADPAAYEMPEPRKHTLVLELTDARNALERCMLHFSPLEKETVRLDETRYQITLRYWEEDETELLIRVLAFGPLVRVVSPDSFIGLIKDRLQKQKDCGL